MTFGHTAIDDKAMILAAGFGKRLAPLTNDTPKPLLKVGDQSLLDYHQNILKNMGFTEVVINTHYLAEKISRHIQNFPVLRSHLTFEKEILDTGGGIKNACTYFKKPFLSINADAFTTGNLQSVLVNFLNAFNPQTTDVLLLLIPTTQMQGYEGSGDFDIDDDNTPVFRGNAVAAPYTYAGIQILNPVLFNDMPFESFSVIKIWEKALLQKRCHVSVVKEPMSWFDTGTLDGFHLANKAVRP